MAQGDQPSARIRIGNVTAAVWKNSEGFYSVTLQKSYREKDSDEWKNTDNLSHGDLLNAARVLERAEEYIARK
jgi:hypothetical protein